MRLVDRLGLGLDLVVLVTASSRSRSTALCDLVETVARKTSDQIDSFPRLIRALRAPRSAIKKRDASDCGRLAPIAAAAATAEPTIILQRRRRLN